MKNGIILLDKRAGISSAKAIAEVKRALKLEKIGHAGTLDPFATGLLVCLAGRATRAAAYAVEGLKVYSGKIRLGVATTTDDMTGDVLDQSNEIPDEAAVLQVVKDHFTGDIIQTPPLISAVKIGGKASYRRVRVLGETPVLPERKVEVLQFEISQSGDRGKFSFRLKCSPGTYIRSIARDLGRRLGCGGCVESLCREASSPFELKMARKIEELSESDMLPWSALFPGLPRYECTSEELDRLAHGDQRPVDGIIRRRKAEVCPENRALYGSPGSGAASGLLVREDGKWRSALYIE